MSLPVVLEIAVGLIFIYLTLSLIASEIQEILSALFQWRAEHLKRSIEQLLAGDRHHSEAREAHYRAAKTLADKLYESSLIQDLNYEAQGRITGLLRSFLHVIGATYRTLTFSRNVFGRKTSGPSYIPAETFATSLIERLRLEDFQQIMMRARFHDFLNESVSLPLHNIVNELRARLKDEDLLEAEMVHFDRSLGQISSDLEARRCTLESALDQVIGQIQEFESMAADTPLSDPAMTQSLLNRVRYLRTGLSNQAQKEDVLVARLRPSLKELTALLDPNSATYAELVMLAQREGDAVRSALETLQQEVIPPRLRDSLSSLAHRATQRARLQTQAARSEMQQFQTEIETWFNHGMDRASGVYRRNVKGVGFLIGLAIAYAVNADTLYMLQRLGSDPAIRSSIIQTAEQLEVQGITSAQDLADELAVEDFTDRIRGNLRSVGTAVEETLADYPLPIGRADAVLNAQQVAQESWPIPFIPQRLLGWSITGLALSMGASFWFDLLRRVTAVRSSGNPPKSST